ncbi:MAG: hypothetical protein ABH879_03385 [archaeon]
MAEVKINYETLFELLRREKGREPLQKLDKTFYSDVERYLAEKAQRMREQEHKADIFSSAERNSARNQIDNTRQILHSLYDRRERKIIVMAINNSRMGSNLVDTSALLDEEKRLFGSLVAEMRKGREEILLSLFNPRPAAKPLPVSSKLRIMTLTDIPKFIGPGLEVIGPFARNTEIELESKVANVLVEKGKAELAAERKAEQKVVST